MNNKIILLVFLLTVTMLCRPAFAQESPNKIFTVKSCISEAARNNPMLLSAEAGKLSADAFLNYEKSLFQPSLDVLAGLGYMAGESTSAVALTSKTNEEGQQVRNVSKAYYFSKLLFEYPIYKEGVFFGKQAPSVIKAETRLDASVNNIGVVRNEVLYNVVLSYLDILKAGAEIKSLEENVTYLQTVFDMSLSKYKLSLLTKDDLLKAEFALATAKTALENMKNTRIQKKSTLAYWMGADQSMEFDLDEGMDDAFFYTAVPVTDHKGLVEKAFTKNPLVLQYQDRVKEAANDIIIAGLPSKPSVSFKAEISGGDDFNPPPRTMLDTSVQVRVPVLDFGRTNFAVEEARHKLTTAQMDLQNIKNSVAKDIAVLLMDIKNIENSVLAAKKGIDSAEESCQHMRQEYTLNTVTIADVLAAQARLASAKNTLVQLNYDYRERYTHLKGFENEISP